MYRHAMMTLVLCSLFAAGCGTSSDHHVRLVHQAAPALSLAVFPILEPEKLHRSLAPLVAHLSARLGRDINVRVAADYADLETLIRQHRVDIGWFEPRSEAGVGSSSSVEPVCRALARGRGFYQGIIVARKDRNVTTLKGLQGVDFGYVDRNSHSGFVYPNRVFERSGIEPLEHFASVAFAGSHDRCLEGVLAGTYQAGAMSDIVLSMSKWAEDFEKRLVILARTDPIPLAPIVVRTNLAGPLKAKIADLFTGLADDAEGKAVLDSLSASLNIECFEPLAERKQ